MKPSQQLLIVEGKNDEHVVYALCERHKIKESFSVESRNSKEKLLASLGVELKVSGREALGMVIDADESLQSSWRSVRDRLTSQGYRAVPEEPDVDGTIITESGRPRVGIWIMPDNNIPGVLENFIASMIPSGDELRVEVENFLDEVERKNLNVYPPVRRPKAFIHTWLACQEEPGRPMGQSITAKVLSHNADIARRFVEWLNRLFNP